MQRVAIFTDGACRGNPGPGGWGAVLRYNGVEKELSGGDPRTTNNRMEMLAAIAALETLNRPAAIDLYTDSTYLRDGITKWIHNWKRRNWRTADNKPVKNADLWRRLDRIAARHDVTWRWIKGHAGHPDNERADRLARSAVPDGPPAAETAPAAPPSVARQPGRGARAAGDALHDRFARIDALRHALKILNWDALVTMPAGGASARADAVAVLAQSVRDHSAADDIGELIAAARRPDMPEWHAANINEIERRWIRARAVPGDLVAAMSKAEMACEQAWRQARAASDWNAVAGPLAEVVRLARAQAAALADALDCPPYDALLDRFEPGLSRQATDPVFAELAAALPPLVDAALGRQPAPADLPGPFPAGRQEALAAALATALGFDFAQGRLDASAHPFTGGVTGDTRITTRYNPDDFRESMFAVLHETGHALYQQGLPAAWRRQPVGEAGGMALHESQALLMENHVGRSDAFLTFAAPVLRRTLGGPAGEADPWRPANLARLARRVERGLIRVDADEMTYPLHIMLRYDLETALISADLQVADLPQAWDEAMARCLGLSCGGDHALGCLQDIHWFAGSFGYFPTYTLGALAAAQLYRAAADAVPGLDAAVRDGRFEVLIDWLRSHVHGLGRLRTTAEIIAGATGAPLGTSAFLSHLRQRYG